MRRSFWSTYSCWTCWFCITLAAWRGTQRKWSVAGLWIRRLCSCRNKRTLLMNRFIVSVCIIPRELFWLFFLSFAECKCVTEWWTESRGRFRVSGRKMDLDQYSHTVFKQIKINSGTCNELQAPDDLFTKTSKLCLDVIISLTPLCLHNFLNYWL